MDKNLLTMRDTDECVYTYAKRRSLPMGVPPRLNGVTTRIDRHPDRLDFIIIHDYAETPGECTPGEEVVAIILIYRGRRYWIPWSPGHLILVDFLARHRWIAQDAWRIAAQMQLDPFVVQHGSNAPGAHIRVARTSRTAVRQQIKRIRDVLQKLFDEEGLDLNAPDIIRSEETSTRSVRYRFNANVTWVHWPLPEGENSTSGLPFPEVPGPILNSARVISLRLGM